MRKAVYTWLIYWHFAAESPRNRAQCWDNVQFNFILHGHVFTEVVTSWVDQKVGLCELQWNTNRKWRMAYRMARISM